jgi:hypothetical protein
MELLADWLFALGQIAALGFAAYGGWLAFRHAHGFLPEGEGRFEYRHVRHGRQSPRKLAGQA